MNAGSKILPTTPVVVNIGNEYSPGFLSGITTTIVKDPSLILVDEILRPLGTNLTLSPVLIRAGVTGARADIDLQLNLNDQSRATSDMAFITFMLSRYHKEYRKYGSASRFAVTVGNANAISFYCMKGFTYAGSENFTTDNDMILASILGLNTVVSSMRDAGMAGMHPLSRMAVTEDGIMALTEYITESDNLFVKYMVDSISAEATTVKLFNTACARKSHQFTGTTKYYFPELAAAQLIMGVMSSKSQNSSLIDITNRNLSKIAKANGGLDKELVVELMEHCTPANSAYNAEEIFAHYKNKTRIRQLPKVPSTVSAIEAFRQDQQQYSDQRMRKTTGPSASSSVPVMRRGQQRDTSLPVDIIDDDGIIANKQVSSSEKKQMLQRKRQQKLEDETEKLRISAARNKELMDNKLYSSNIIQRDDSDSNQFGGGDDSAQFVGDE